MGEEEGERNERKREERYGRARVSLVTQAIKSVCCIYRQFWGTKVGPVNKQHNNWMWPTGVGRYSSMKYNNTFNNRKT